jgi:hypothetical protein
MSAANLETCKNALDWGCAAVAAGAVAGILPPLAALVTIVYGVLRIRDLLERRARQERDQHRRHDDPPSDD